MRINGTDSPEVGKFLRHSSKETGATAAGERAAAP